jgi:hypothetical protein
VCAGERGPRSAPGRRFCPSPSYLPIYGSQKRKPQERTPKKRKPQKRTPKKRRSIKQLSLLAIKFWVLSSLNLMAFSLLCLRSLEFFLPERPVLYEATWTCVCCLLPLRWIFLLDQCKTTCRKVNSGSNETCTCGHSRCSECDSRSDEQILQRMTPVNVWTCVSFILGESLIWNEVLRMLKCTCRCPNNIALSSDQCPIVPM